MLFFVTAASVAKAIIVTPGALFGAVTMGVYCDCVYVCFYLACIRNRELSLLAICVHFVCVSIRISFGVNSLLSVSWYLWLGHSLNLRHVTSKPVCGVSDQVRQTCLLSYRDKLVES